MVGAALAPAWYMATSPSRRSGSGTSVAGAGEGNADGGVMQIPWPDTVNGSASAAPIRAGNRFRSGTLRGVVAEDHELVTREPARVSRP